MPGSQLIRGFTLMELLVTLTILAFGILGLSGLVTRGQRAAFDAYQRQQALALAADMAERIKSLQSTDPDQTARNAQIGQTYADGAPVATPLGDGSKWGGVGGDVTDCGATSAVCTWQQLVDFDLAVWDGLLAGATKQRTVSGNVERSGSILGARGCVEKASASPLVYRVSVAWQGESPITPGGSNDPRSLTNCAKGGYKMPDGSDEATGGDSMRRVVSVDVPVLQP